MYEAAQALKEFPLLTAYFENQSIHYYDDVRIGVAVDVGNGLKIATLPGTAQLLPIQIFETITDFAYRDLEGSLTDQDFSDSTFTITDLTAQRILHFVPLINGKQSGILGIGGDPELPGQPLSLNLTFDHRVLAGREAALFLDQLRSRILAYV